MRCPNPNFVWPNDVVMAVPCGKCLACLSNKRNDWAFRLMQEYKVSSSAFFVTLTYSERFLPEHGVVKRHLQLYFKRLRKLCPGLRYYAVGEYGSITKRPHYHAIVFNVSEQHVRGCWSLRDKKKEVNVPIGICHIGKVTEASVSYVLKYIVQSEEGVPDGYNRGFAIMSRGHGLGGHYLTDAMVKWHREGDRVFMMKYGEKLRLPRFYKDKIWPSSSWSDWAYQRDRVLRKSRKEAEKREEDVYNKLVKSGYSPAQIEEMRTSNLSGIKRKVAFSQKL